MAANELEEKDVAEYIDDVPKDDITLFLESCGYDVDKDMPEFMRARVKLQSLIESEKVKAVEEYRQKLNAYWPEGSEEPTLSAEQMKTILNRVLKERNK